MTKPYDSRSEVRAEDVAGVLNELYEAGYSLKELLPEISGASEHNTVNQYYTVLVVKTHAGREELAHDSDWK